MNTLKNNFIKPPKGYGMVPFWFWNDDLDHKHLLFQMKEMKDKGIDEFIIHARFGLEVQYLSDLWFDKVAFALERAEELEMKVWIYDEENWPSGYAGGRVLSDNFEHCARYLSMEKEKLTSNRDFILIPEINDKTLVSVMAKNMNGRLINLTDSLSGGKVMNEDFDEIYTFYMCYTQWNPAYSKEYYIDLLNKEAAASFMRHTHCEYKRRLGKYFGHVIKGFFVDEPGFYNNFRVYEDRIDHNTIPWTGEFASYFLYRNGYDVTTILPYLWEDLGTQSAQARVDFYSTLSAMYKDAFLQPLKRFCEENGMQSIGHFAIEEYISCHIRGQGNLMEALDSLSFSGIDRIETNFEKITEKYGSSASHIFGHSRTLSETYANIGWSITLEQMKQIANWQYVRGINMLIPHAFYSSIEGERKWESPPSEFFQAPFWPWFGSLSAYIKRLSYLLSQGRHVCDVAVYFPIASCQALITPDNANEVDAFDRLFIDMSNSLLDSQHDFDYVIDRVIVDGHIDKGHLLVKDESYRAVIIPTVSFMPFAVVSKLEKFAESGGMVIIIGKTDIRCLEAGFEGMFSTSWNRLLAMDKSFIIDKYNINKYYTYKFDGDKIADLLISKGISDFQLLNKDATIKYLHRRHENCDIYFLINESSLCKVINFEVDILGSVEKWNAMDGTIMDYYAVSANENSMVISATLQPYGAEIFVITSGGVPRIYDHDKGMVYIGNGSWQAEANGLYNVRSSGKDSTVEVRDVPALINLGGLWEIAIKGEVLKKPLQSWSEWGFGDYSGQADYVRDFQIDFNKDIQYILELGKVYEQAEVWVNGRLAGYGLWLPYTFDITAYLVDGQNKLVIKVINTLANEYEGKPLISGLIGPIVIKGCRSISVGELRNTL